MSFGYNPLFVALSILVAIQAAYVGLNLAQLIPAAVALNRRLKVAGSAISLAVGIWSMHFVGMLAVVTSVRIDYAVLPTLISFLVCVLVTGVAIFFASLRVERPPVIAAIAMGLGISAMHFIGMQALHSSLEMSYDPVFVLASVVIAIAASGLALWLSFAPHRKPPLFLSSVILGSAISGMHYMAMAGTTWRPMTELHVARGEALSSDLLAVIMSLVAFSISGIFMLTLIPSELKHTPEIRTPNSTDEPATPAPLQLVNEGKKGTESVQIQNDLKLDADFHDILPIEKRGKRLNISYNEVISVRADAHYTYVFNGNDDLFCPISITELETRLPKEDFFRTHRSYIVSLAHVSAVKRAADAGIAELDSPIQRSVPVSRGRMAALRKELSERHGKTGDTGS